MAPGATSSIMRWHWMWAFGLNASLPCMTVKRDFQGTNWTLQFPYNAGSAAVSVSIPAARAETMDTLDVCAV
jgi:hypothetical protein